jgi:hypothetical protein
MTVTPLRKGTELQALEPGAGVGYVTLWVTMLHTRSGPISMLSLYPHPWMLSPPGHA